MGSGDLILGVCLQNIGNMDVGDDKRDIISREIRIFRDTYMKVMQH